MLTTNELKLFTKQIQQASIDLDGQTKLKNAKVLCVGVGGLGTPVSLYLASCGIGTLGLMDGDKIELSNLHRQILFSFAETGESKVASAKKRLTTINPYCDIKTINKFITHENALEVFNDYDIIVDCTDNFSTRYLINDACAELNKPYVYAAVANFSGHLCVFNPKQSPCLRCLFPEPPANPPANCAEAGILGVVPGILGTLQALEVIKFILNLEGVLLNQFMTINLLNYEKQIFTVTPAKDCPCCALKQSFNALPKYFISCASKASLTAKEFKQAITKDKLLVDVRTTAEFNSKNIPDAINIPLDVLPKQAQTLPKDKSILLYCKAGIRCRYAYEYLSRQGFSDICFLSESLEEFFNCTG